MFQPPPPPKSETRQHPRYELAVSVEVRYGEKKLVLPARNISLGGMYLAAAGKRLNRLRVGEMVEIVVFDAYDDKTPTIHTTARVARNEGQGIGLSWSTSDPDLLEKVSAILDRIVPR